MVDFAFQFNASQYEPKFSGGSPGLPVGRHPVVITDGEFADTKAGDGSKMLVLVASCYDGPAKGQTQDIRLNVQNKSAQASRVAYSQLSAICCVVGQPHGIQQALSEIWNKPFIIEISPQRETEANKGKGYTEVSNVYTLQGLDATGKPMPQAGPGSNMAQAPNGGPVAHAQPQPGPGPGAFAPQPQPQPQPGGFAPQPGAGFAPQPGPGPGPGAGFAPQPGQGGGFAPQPGAQPQPGPQPGQFAPQPQPGGFGGFPPQNGAAPQQGGFAAPQAPGGNAPWGAR